MKNEHEPMALIAIQAIEGSKALVRTSVLGDESSVTHTGVTASMSTRSGSVGSHSGPSILLSLLGDESSVTHTEVDLASALK